jgi:uncharacterized UPF0160 family protein
MSRDQLADWLHCLHGGMYDWVQEEIQKELAKPNQFFPDWDTLQPFHERIAELEKELAKPEPTPVAWAVLRPDGRVKMLSHQQGVEVDLKWTPLYTAPPRKPWQGLTNEEVQEITKQLVDDAAYCSTHFAIAIEAELRRKNNAV